MKHHIARKAIKHVSDSGEDCVTPPKENGMKLELFVFDVFEVGGPTGRNNI